MEAAAALHGQLVLRVLLVAADNSEADRRRRAAALARRYDMVTGIRCSECSEPMNNELNLFEELRFVRRAADRSAAAAAAAAAKKKIRQAPSQKLPTKREHNKKIPAEVGR